MAEPIIIDGKWGYTCPVCGDKFITDYEPGEVAHCTIDCLCGALLYINGDLTCSDFYGEFDKSVVNYFEKHRRDRYQRWRIVLRRAQNMEYDKVWDTFGKGWYYVDDGCFSSEQNTQWIESKEDFDSFVKSAMENNLEVEYTDDPIWDDELH